MSYSFYSFFHLMSIFAVIMSLSVTAMHVSGGGTKQNLKQRRLLSLVHGIGLLLALVAGFGLMARAGFQFSTSTWIYVKLLCWLLLGVYPVFLYRNFVPPRMAIVGLFLIVTLAVYTVVFKPV